jgi:hypothetical protein
VLCRTPVRRRDHREQFVDLRELLDVLTRSDTDRAALIGRLYQREDAAWLAELLVDMEEDEPAPLRPGGGLAGDRRVDTASVSVTWDQAGRHRMDRVLY